MRESGWKVTKSEDLDLHLSTTIYILLSDTQNMDSFLPKFPQL